MIVDPGPLPLVALPGMNCSPRLWAGVGRTNLVAPVLEESTLDAEVERLLDLLPPRFSLIGLSLGAIVAMALVRTAPERVSRLCLLSTSARPPTDLQRATWAGLRTRLAAGTTAREVQQELLPVLLSPDAASTAIAQALDMADDIGSDRLDRQLALQTTRVDERRRLGEVRCPTTVVGATADLLCPPDRHEEIAGLIPRARLVLLGRTAHLSPLERPARVAALLRAWSGPGAGQP